MNKNIHTVISVTIMVISMASVNVALSHGGGQAVNGGVVEVLGDVAFELVVLDDGVELYVVDDGVEVPVDNMKAKLKIENADEKSELILKPDGRNRFAIRGKSIDSGSEVVAVVTREDGYSKIIINFVVE